MRYLIKTFGCQMNVADSERVAAAYAARGFAATEALAEADHVIVNTCLVRQAAEDRIYGLVRNLTDWRERKEGRKIILTGCLVGLAVRDKTGRILRNLQEKLPEVDEFLPITEAGFDQAPLRAGKANAWVPISNGCNNFCSFCVVPYTRGPEVSRPWAEIIDECRQLKAAGYKEVTLLGQNVNSYGADIINIKSQISNINPSTTLRVDGERSRTINPSTTLRVDGERSRTIKDTNKKLEIKVAGRTVEPIYVKHMGKYRVPTLFPYLLAEVAKLGFDGVNFISSNPWDFSEELIEVIAAHPNIARTIHLPVQSGDDEILRKMNRGYTRDEYLKLIAKLKVKIQKLKITTDIIVGFPGEMEEQFANTVDLCRRVGFEKAYIAMYSPRPRTVAQRTMADDVSYLEKKRRWQVLEDLINKPHAASRLDL